MKYNKLSKQNEQVIKKGKERRSTIVHEVEKSAKK